MEAVVQDRKKLPGGRRMEMKVYVFPSVLSSHCPVKAATKEKKEPQHCASKAKAVSMSYV